MTKKDILQKIAIKDVSKFTSIGLAAGSVPGILELARAHKEKDPEKKKDIRRSALKQLGVGAPLGGSLGYALGTGTDFIKNVNTKINEKPLRTMSKIFRMFRKK